ncbi:nitrate reductase gamma subunit [Streptoalloteichus tenebrarius]|uniref:Nitrate reductase gamma subunit n=1 Tax=Streptoalloteichus tenebrarius (strain ATCC 17920 / DSM 40477 / JCM 4838 / CBS 697.72 / NBRC 16177 / NCIMB 11028 / NRRL B-12390 / A12253. 1 / ISP 5477) TaxID=1933 RepID=A0ABT1HRT3_STRSD|nr:respiratory nitrate reductase subunit gamma [Streptoalloteichus tenebrarius]MCP2258227.1 nitrate reductase gamma subunit [Streptoalloteichus tenebrarius]BFF04543.1 respiratory nitrate reductase subunit gamma [Streptoalloteichus tenebrarius]
MTTVDVVLWTVLPYVALTVFVVGHVWRWRVDQFGWTTRTTQVLESRWLRLGSPLFHIGILMAIAGHAMGLLVPKTWTEAVGVSEHTYHVMALAGGVAAAVLVVVGLVLLLLRRVVNGRVRRTTNRMDKALYLVLTAVITFGVVGTVGRNLLGGGYDYRETIAVWFRGVFWFHPRPELMVDVPLVFQLHALSALVLFAMWPFTRLVHVWSVPLAYLCRPYVVYRRRRPRTARLGAAAVSAPAAGVSGGRGHRPPRGPSFR